jgi:hypothetical protein
MPGLERRPLSPAQQQTAIDLPWYRAWRQSTGRTKAEVDPTTYQHAPPVDAAAGGDVRISEVPVPAEPPVDSGLTY